MLPFDLMKQPTLGIISSVLVILVSLGFISIFRLPTFTTWVAYLMICLIPMVVVISVTWAAKHPAFAVRHAQPARGLLFVLLLLAAGVPVALVHFVAVGGSVSPPTPMVSMCIITTVVVAFWFAIVWGGWPFSRLMKNPAAGLLMLVAGYVVNYLLFRLFFNYGFMKGTPAYQPAQDPHGLFNAWNAVVFFVTAISAMFLLVCFELWPLAKRPALTRQPLLGAVWTAIMLGIGGLAVFVGEGLLGMEAPAFMVRAPIPFVFGTIIVMNMMEGSLFARFSQPLKGVLNAATAAVIGVGLARLYGALGPIVSGHMEPGPPGYVFEIWLASALLAVTFPFLVIFAELFQFWPLRRARRR